VYDQTEKEVSKKIRSVCYVKSCGNLLWCLGHTKDVWPVKSVPFIYLSSLLEQLGGKKLRVYHGNDH